MIHSKLPGDDKNFYVEFLWKKFQPKISFILEFKLNQKQKLKRVAESILFILHRGISFQCSSILCSFILLLIIDHLAVFLVGYIMILLICACVFFFSLLLSSFTVDTNNRLRCRALWLKRRHGRHNSDKKNRIIPLIKGAAIFVALLNPIRILTILMIILVKYEDIHVGACTQSTQITLNNRDSGFVT